MGYLDTPYRQVARVLEVSHGDDVGDVLYSEVLEHSGQKGMRWGIRRYQNKDGTLTEEGKKRYGKGSEKKYDYTSETKDYKLEEGRHLSDEELKKRTNRINSENNYYNSLRINQENYMSEHDRKSRARKERTKKIFVDSATNAASEVMKSVYVAATKKFIDNLFPSLNVSGKKNNDGGNKQQNNNNNNNNRNNNNNNNSNNNNRNNNNNVSSNKGNGATNEFGVPKVPPPMMPGPPVFVPKKRGHRKK